MVSNVPFKCQIQLLHHYIAAEDSRAWFTKLQARLGALRDVADNIAAVNAASVAAAGTGDVMSPEAVAAGAAGATLKLAVAAANKVDGLDRINAAVAARRNKREGKSGGGGGGGKAGKAVKSGAGAAAAAGGAGAAVKEKEAPKTAAELAEVASSAALAADAALAAVTDPTKRAAVQADAKKPKATTTVGRLVKAAENAKLKAQQEADKERAKVGWWLQVVYSIVTPWLDMKGVHMVSHTLSNHVQTVNKTRD